MVGIIGVPVGIHIGDGIIGVPVGTHIGAGTIIIGVRVGTLTGAGIIGVTVGILGAGDRVGTIIGVQVGAQVGIPDTVTAIIGEAGLTDIIIETQFTDVLRHRQE